ncbi:MAG TPA: hypothetical protein VNJ11_14460 [Bryobacteraceae bacterium]|nr:hypothetical protein [Bryobacteraceae bacterium]
MTSTWLAVLAALLSSYPLAAETTEKVIAAKWEELPALLEAKQVEATLADGSYVRGRVRKVAADWILLEIQATSNPTRFPRGLQRVPKELWLRVRAQWHTKGRFVGLVVGGLVAIPVARLSWDKDFTGFTVAVFSGGVISACSYLGYRLGKAGGERHFVVQIVAEHPEPGLPAVTPEQPPTNVEPTC